MDLQDNVQLLRFSLCPAAAFCPLPSALLSYPFLQPAGGERAVPLNACAVQRLTRLLLSPLGSETSFQVHHHAYAACAVKDVLCNGSKGGMQLAET